ncbi:unnamed protein product [Camellia sinensis]
MWKPFLLQWLIEGGWVYSKGMGSDGERERGGGLCVQNLKIETERDFEQRGAREVRDIFSPWIE